MDYISPNFLTFLIPITNESKFPDQFYEEVEMLGLTDPDTIKAHAINRGYKPSTLTTGMIKASFSRNEIEGIVKIMECTDNIGWSNLEFESGEIITVIMEHDLVIEYVDQFIIYESNEEDDEPEEYTATKKEKIKIKND